MKRILLLTALLINAVILNAQNTFPSNGNVGIGTTEPSANLQIQNLTQNTDIDLLKFKVNYDGAFLKRRGISWEDIYSVTGRIDTRYDGTVTKMIFGSLYNSGYTSTDIMTISGNGNVGIGTSNPIPHSNGKSLIISGSDTQRAIIELWGENSGKGVLQSVQGSTYLGNLSKGNGDGNTFVSYGNGTIGLTLKGANGNLGIGTQNPLANLHINASLNGQSSIRLGEANSSGDLNVPLGASPGGYDIDFYTWRDVQPDQIGARIRAERINAYQNNNALVQSMDLVFSTSAGGGQTDLSEKFRIKASGNVGIGTANPTEKLSVNGKIRSKEVKVEATNWPDYVFEDSYKSTSLSELESYIKTNKHLPEIPSAKEVEENGISLGEMNAKLLKKIEEMTMMLIELKKENGQLADRINNLENK